MSHSQRRTVSELGGIERPSFWVSESYDGHAPESPEDVRFALQRSASGLWTVAVRGYNGGDPITAQVSEDDSDVRIQVGDRSYIAIEGNRPLHEVPEDLEDDYFSAMYDPEPATNLLVQVLEEERAGVFSILPTTDRVGQLIMESPKQAALCWKLHDPEAKFLPISIEHIGPEFHFVSRNGDKLAKFSSLTERTNYHTSFAVRTREPDDPAFAEDLAFLDQLHKAD